MNGHPSAGNPTFFVEKVLNGLNDYSFAYNLPNTVFNKDNYETMGGKIHTIRAGSRFKAGDSVSLRVWSDKPYRSKQIAIAPDIVIPRVAEIYINCFGSIFIDGKQYCDIYQPSAKLELLAKNDGLTMTDFRDWFVPYILGSQEILGQIIFFTNAKTPY